MSSVPIIFLGEKIIVHQVPEEMMTMKKVIKSKNLHGSIPAWKLKFKVKENYVKKELLSYNKLKTTSNDYEIL